MIPTPDQATTQSVQSDHEKNPALPEPLDILLSFGEGPVKPVLLQSELTVEQLSQWERYKQDQVHADEPDFWIMEQPRYLAMMDKIIRRTDIDDEQKRSARQEVRKQWQRIGWFGLRKWGRQNALASGYALYNGLTERVILTGGRTIPAWAVERLPLDLTQDWPSEAELMADIIVSHYGDMYRKRYGFSIESRITIEDKATNTLQNFAYSINKHPELILPETRIGLLTAGHHLRRVTMLAHMFSIRECETGSYSAQTMIGNAPDIRDQIKDELFLRLIDIAASTDATKLEAAEKRWIQGLTDPMYLTYWLGYLGDVMHPTVIQNALKSLNTPTWQNAARAIFAKLGLNADDYLGCNLCELQRTNSAKYDELIVALQKLKDPELRIHPPEIQSP